MPKAPPPPTAQEPPSPIAPHPSHYQNGSPPTTPHHPGPQRVWGPTARMGNRQQHGHNGTLRWDEITPGLQAIRVHSITEPTTTWALPADRHHLLLTVQGDAAVTPTEGDSITAASTHAVDIPRQTSSAAMMVHSGPNPWQAIVITYPAPNDHTHTWQQRWEGVCGDLLQKHLGLTSTHHTLHLVRGVGQASHGLHTPGFWAYATPINPQAAEDIGTVLSIQQAQTQTPHRNTQRGYTIWWVYQDHDTLTPQTRPPPPQTPTPPPSSRPQQRHGPR